MCTYVQYTYTQLCIYNCIYFYIYITYVYTFCVCIIRVLYRYSWLAARAHSEAGCVVMVEVQQLMAKEAASMVAKLGSQAQLRLSGERWHGIFSGHFRGFNGIYIIG